MSSFYLMSLFDRQFEKLRQRQERVMREIEDFLGLVESSAGEETAALFRSYLDIPWGYRYAGGRLPEIPPEGQPLLDDFLKLNRREAAPATPDA